MTKSNDVSSRAGAARECGHILNSYRLFYESTSYYIKRQVLTANRITFRSSQSK